MNKKTHAIILRKQGLSYGEISKKLNIPKSTLSTWLCDIHLSNNARSKIQAKGRRRSIAALQRSIKQRSANNYNQSIQIKRRAKGTINKFSKNDLFISGVALYWAEGYKRGGNAERGIWRAVDIANSDPALIAFMMRFFRQCCDVEEKKFRIHLMIYQGQNILRVRKYWSDITRLPLKNISTISVLPTKPQTSHRLPFGTAHIRIYDIRLFYTVMGWLEGFQRASFLD